MTGAVSWEVLIWVVGLVIAAGGVVAGFLFWVWRLVSGFNKMLAERDSAAQLEKERAKLVEEELRRDLSNYKVHAAEHYATKEGVSQAVGRVETSIKGLAQQVEGAVDRLTGRIDRLLDGSNDPPAPRRRNSGG